MLTVRRILVTTLLLSLAGCAGPPPEPEEGYQAFVGATVIDGLGNPPIEDAVILVRDGRIEGVGTRAQLPPPPTAAPIDVSGKTIIPGLIVGHGHVGATKGLEADPKFYTEENILDQLRLYARYGVTTVTSLGGDGEEAIRLRNAQDTPDLDRARIFVAGKVVDAKTPDAARKMVDENVAMKVNFIKIRVDDNLGATKKMPRDVSKAIIDQAHRKGVKVAAHLYYLGDAKALLEDEVDFIAHSIRDKEVDAELVQTLLKKEVCLCPTLTREVSTYVYESVPDFFSDPFFLKEADPAVLEQLKDPERQKKIQSNKAAQQYKVALDMAMKNLKTLADSGVKIVFGTDTGPPARFQGYFEHMEMELMAKAGLSPLQIIQSATGDAAQCLGLYSIGSIKAGNWADMVVLGKNPLDDINNTKSIESVWIAGNQVPGKN
jgi:imidazolonepropionase-like amidohydrolase